MRITALLFGLLATLLGVVPPAQAGSDTPPLVRITGRDLYFSPNGDGVADRSRTVYRLERRAYLVAVVRDAHGEVVSRERIGDRKAGRHVYRWDGRRADGALVDDGYYRILLRALGASTTGRASSATTAVTRPDRGRLVLSRPTVYPAATVVEDHLAIAYVRQDDSEDDRLYSRYYGTRPLKLSSRLQVVGPDGDVVHRARTHGYRQLDDWTARDADGRPLPPGRYQVRLTVTDEVGNVRRVARAVQVSAAQLRERTWTSTVPAASAEPGYGPVYDPSCLGCGETCGPVPSERFPGGLSFRQPCDFGYAAVRYSSLTPPVVPAPVDSYRITATGGPTTPGGTDVAHVAGLVIGPGDTSVTTEWRDVDLTAYPYLPDARTPVSWGTSTDQGNDYDIASYTVEYRSYEPVP